MVAEPRVSETYGNPSEGFAGAHGLRFCEILAETVAVKGVVLCVSKGRCACVRAGVSSPAFFLGSFCELKAACGSVSSIGCLGADVRGEAVITGGGGGGGVQFYSSPSHSSS